MRTPSSLVRRVWIPQPPPVGPFVRAVTEGGNASNVTSHQATTPLCEVGDLLTLSWTLNTGHGAVTPPSNVNGTWTRVFPTTITDDGLMTLLVYQKVAVAADVDGETYTLTTATVARDNWGALAIGDADTGAPNDLDSTTGFAATSSLTSTPTVANTLIVSILALDTGTQNSVPTSPLTERWDPVGNGGAAGQVNAGAAASQASAGAVSYGWTWTDPLDYKQVNIAVAEPTGAITGEATLAVTVGFTAAGVRGAEAGATLAVTVGLTAAGVRGAEAGATLAVTAGLTAVGVRGAVGGATLAVTVGLTATGEVGVPPITGEATLAVTAGLVATGRLAAVGGATLAVTAGLTAVGVRGAVGAATLAVTAGLTAVGVRGAVAAAAIPVTVGFTAVGQLGAVGAAVLAVQVNVSGSAATLGDATLLITVGRTAAAAREATGQVLVAVTVGLTAAAVRGQFGGAAVAVTVPLLAGGVAAILAAANVVAVTVQIVASGEVVAAYVPAHVGIDSGATLGIWRDGTSRVGQLEDRALVTIRE